MTSLSPHVTRAGESSDSHVERAAGCDTRAPLIAAPLATRTDEAELAKPLGPNPRGESSLTRFRSPDREPRPRADEAGPIGGVRVRGEGSAGGDAEVTERLKDTWRGEQQRLRQRLVVGDAFDWQPPPLLRSAGNAERTGDGESMGGAGIGECRDGWGRADAQGDAKGRGDGEGGCNEGCRHDLEGGPYSQLQPPQSHHPQLQPPQSHLPQLRPPLVLVGGVDVSFHKSDPNLAAACLTVVAFPSLHLLHSEITLTRVTQPYIPGFLAFRECGVLVGLIERLRQTQPQLVPQVIMVDGNGIFHPQGFGLACQLGVLTDIPTIGVAKNAPLRAPLHAPRHATPARHDQMYYMDGMADEHVCGLQQQHLHHPGDWALLKGSSGATHAALVRGGPGSHDPVFVSVGHRVSLESAVAVTQRCFKHRVPEPVRLADGMSRAELRGVAAAST
ncbi:hypothetical protein CLOM_g17504 [Closterium sp. NIES-68]|nr:hypothetical protein CLOM_g17504 [Closterium sp. NIES-68]